MRRRLPTAAVGRLRRRRRRECNPDGAYAVEACRPPFGEPGMAKHAWVLPIIMIIVIVRIKVRVKR